MDDQDENKIPTLTLPTDDNSIDLSGLSTTITIDCNSWANSCISSTCYPSYYSGASTTIPSITWGNINNISTYTTSAANVMLDNNGVTLKNGADITIGERSLLKTIEAIEERLGILHPNPELEDRWEELKELRSRYIELEKELLEKEKMWDILKKK